MIPLSFRTNSLSDRKKTMIFFYNLWRKNGSKDTGRTKLKERLSLPKQEETDTTALN